MNEVPLKPDFGDYDPSRLADFIAAEIGKYGEDAEKFYRSVFGDALTVKKDEVATA